MEKMVEIDLWSDNWKGKEIIDVLHDMGIKTSGMHREIIGNRSEEIEWGRCKAGECSALVVDLFGDSMRTTAEHMHDVKDVEEKPLFLYKLNIIVDEPDNGEEDTEEEEEREESTMEEEEEREESTMEDKTTNVVMNIGMTTKDGVKMNISSAIDRIGKETDCTITPTVGFYHGKREDSLKVDIYDTRADIAVSMASYFCYVFQQECVAVTIGDSTVFVTNDYTDTEFVAWCDALEK